MGGDLIAGATEVSSGGTTTATSRSDWRRTSLVSRVPCYSFMAIRW